MLNNFSNFITESKISSRITSSWENDVMLIYDMFCLVEDSIDADFYFQIGYTILNSSGNPNSGWPCYIKDHEIVGDKLSIDSVIDKFNGSLSTIIRIIFKSDNIYHGRLPSVAVLYNTSDTKKVVDSICIISPILDKISKSYSSMIGFKEDGIEIQIKEI